MKITLFTFLLLLSATLLAQQVSYQILEDNPEKAYTKFIAPELGSEWNSPALSIFVGANGRFQFVEAFTVEAAVRYDVYKSAGKGPAFLLEGGIFLPLATKIKKKDVPVVLSYDPYAGEVYKDGRSYNVEETKSINIPNGQYKNQLGVRGGLHTRRVGASDLSETINSGIMLSGIYLGGQFTSQAYVKTKINDDVERIGAGFGKYFFDILVLPVSNLQDPFASYDVKADGVIGWRAGFQWYVSPHDGEYKMLRNSVFTAEIGKRPLSGFMFNMTWGFALMSTR